MIIVFTGKGKGKTTAALGQAIRALGEGRKAVMIQFIKGPWKSGEDFFFEKIKIPAFAPPSPKWLRRPSKASAGKPNSKFKIIKGGKGFIGILGDRLPRSVHKKAAKETLKLAEKTILSKKYDLVILDEVNVAVNLKLISQKDVLRVLKKAPGSIDIILTGRKAPQEFINLADIATEMKEIKFKYRPAKEGIEY